MGTTTERIETERTILLNEIEVTALEFGYAGSVGVSPLAVALARLRFLGQCIREADKLHAVAE